MKNIFKNTEGGLEREGAGGMRPAKNLILIGLIIILIVAIIAACIIGKSGNKASSEQQEAIAQLSDTTDSMISELDAISDRLAEMDSAVTENMELIESQNSDSTLSVEKTLEEIQKNVEVLQNTLEKIKETNVISTKETTKELVSIKENLDSLEKELSELMEKDFSSLSETMIANHSELVENMKSLENRLDESKQSIESLIERISKTELKNQEELKKILADMKTELDANMTSTKDELAALDTEHYKDLSKQMDSLHGQIDSTQNKIAALQDKLQSDSSKNMEEIKKSFSEVKEELDAIQNAYTVSQKSIEDLINKFAADEESHHEKTIASLEEMNENLLQSGADNLTSMITNLSELEQSYLTSMEELTQYLGNSFDTVNQSIENTENNLSSQFDAKYQVLIEGQNEMNENISNQFMTINNNMSNNNDDVIAALNSALGEMKSELQSVFTFVSNGKRLLASALLTKGVSVPEDASFAEIRDGILAIKQTIYLGTETQYIPGTISYDYHHHVDGSGAATGGAANRSQSGGCYTTPVYHSHTNSCYETYTYTATRWEPISWNWTNDHYHGNSYTGVPDKCRSCSYCGACEIDGGHNDHGRQVEYTATGKRLKCTKTPGQTVEYYVPACGLSEGQIIGAHIVYEQGATASTASVMSMMYEDEPVDLTEEIISERVISEDPTGDPYIPENAEDVEETGGDTSVEEPVNTEENAEPLENIQTETEESEETESEDSNGE